MVTGSAERAQPRCGWKSGTHGRAVEGSGILPESCQSRGKSNRVRRPGRFLPRLLPESEVENRELPEAKTSFPGEASSF